MHVVRSLGHVVGGTLLIAGTAIGVGMLALPVATAEGGFFPAVSVYILCWLFMLFTGLLLLEVCVWMPKDSNLITISRHLLGQTGKNICWLLYLFLFVTVMIAHVVAGGDILREIFGNQLPSWMGMIIYVILFSPIVYLGARSVDRLNLCIMSGVIVSYFLFIGTSYTHINLKLLEYSNWSKAWMALPVLFTAFTYQLIIPTLMSYMDRNVKKVRLAIILGTTIPLVVYLIWEFLILGIIPIQGPGGLAEAAQKGQNAVVPLKQFLNNPTVYNISKSFAFFTLTTSYIALALAFLDFLSDGLSIPKIGLKKVALCLMIFIPPTIIALTYKDIFITALRYAGGFSCAILFGLYPPLMVWVGRYIKKFPAVTPQLFGGKIMLAILIFFVVVEVVVEIGQQLSLF